MRGRRRKETRKKKIPSGAVDAPACKEQIHDGMWGEKVRWEIRFGTSGLELLQYFSGCRHRDFISKQFQSRIFVHVPAPSSRNGV